MSCTMSTPLSQVAIRLSAPGKASRLIFAVGRPGHFSKDGWQLEVRGGEARLVIPNAQPAQAGEYTWYLVGTHRSVGHISLNVSEPLVTEATSTLPAAPGTRLPPHPPASTLSPVHVLLAVPILLAVIVPTLLAVIVSDLLGIIVLILLGIIIPILLGIIVLIALAVIVPVLVLTVLLTQDRRILQRIPQEPAQPGA